MIFRLLERRVGAELAALMLFVFLMLVLWALSSLWTAWGRDYWKQRARTAETAAHTHKADADSARAGASNATATRRAIDQQLPAMRAESAERVARIHDYAQEPDHAVPPDLPRAAAERLPADARILRELRDAEAKAQAASDRLRGADTR